MQIGSLMSCEYGGRHPRPVRPRGGSTTPDDAAFRSGPALLLVIAAAAVVLTGLQPEPVRIGPLRFDRVTAAAALLVAGLGLVVLRYAARHLRGVAGRRAFLGWTVATVTSAWTLAVADHLGLLVATWIGVGLASEQLLRATAGPRSEARTVARWKAAADRIADVSLIAAAGLAWWLLGVEDLTGLVEQVAASGSTRGATVIVGLIAIAAIVRSAQVPWHGWLPGTVASPTPASALLHAGVVNGGGLLLVRIAGAVAVVPEVWIILSLAGCCSIAVAAPAAWCQARRKSGLAWSTVSQMGFMLVQCGLCLGPAAMLHMVGHGIYKAWNFLGAGELPTTAAGPPPAPGRGLLLLGSGTLAAVPAAAFGLDAFGLASSPGPGKLAMLAVVAIAVGQSWVAILGTPAPTRSLRPARIATATLAAITMPLLVCGLFAAARWWWSPAGAAAGPDLSGPTAVAAWLVAVPPVLLIAGLAVLHLHVARPDAGPLIRRLRVHAAGGFYLGIRIGRLLDVGQASLRRLFNGWTHA